MTNLEAGILLAEHTAQLQECCARLTDELAAVRACFAEASQDNVIASARIVELEKLLKEALDEAWRVHLEMGALLQAEIGRRGIAETMLAELRQTLTP